MMLSLHGRLRPAIQLRCKPHASSTLTLGACKYVFVADRNNMHGYLSSYFCRNLGHSFSFRSSSMATWSPCHGYVVRMVISILIATLESFPIYGFGLSFSSMGW